MTMILSHDELAFVSTTFKTKHIAPPNATTQTIHQLLTKMNQAQVICTIADSPTSQARQLLSRLVGRPIPPAKPWHPVPLPPLPRPAPPTAATPATPPTTTKLIDRTITAIAPNPKRPGSSAHDRFRLYQIGQTLAQYLAAGGSIADVKWDLERKYITVT